MSGHKSFKVLRDRMDADPERRERVERLHQAYDVVLGLAELRESRGLTQARLAESLDVSQPNVSRIEGKEDLRLSTLCSYVEALGGYLEVKAVFPDYVVDLALPGISSEKTERPPLKR